MFSCPYLANELYLLPFYILHHHDLHLGEEVEGEVRHGVSEDRLLDEQHVTSGLLDLLHDVQDVLPLLLQHSVHLTVV